MIGHELSIEQDKSLAAQVTHQVYESNFATIGGLAKHALARKETPDAKKAARLQTEISKLESQLDQKRVDHMIKMRKLNPNAGSGRGFMGGGQKGYGPRYGGGYCWR